MRFTYKEVKEYINSLGYELITNFYKNNAQKLTLKDKNGYYYLTTLNNLRSGNKPNYIDKSNPYTIQNIKLWCKLNNKEFELISEVYEGAQIKLKWKCLKDDCQEEFEKEWNSISQNHGCPYCVGQKVNIKNCLATKNPELAKEWHPTLNGDLTPYDVTFSSAKEVWWQCSRNPKHEWKRSIAQRNRERGCPYCSNKPGRKLPSEDYNLLVINPELCKEWDYEKNDKLPEDYTPHANSIVSWVCSKNPKHKWDADISNRVNGNGCPYCRGLYPSEDYNLLVCNPELCKEWDYSKNDKNPNEYTPVSGQSVYWKCKNCGYSWKTKISHRYNGTGCPKCGETKGEKEVRYTLINKNEIFDPQYIFWDLLSDLGNPLRFDFVVFYDKEKTKIKLLVEYDGEFHYFPLLGKKKLEKQKYHDQLKNDYCEKNNIKLLRIPYWDFDNIESILTKELKECR